MSDHEKPISGEENKREGYALDRPPLTEAALYRTLPGSSVSFADLYTRSYGDLGVGWDFIVEDHENVDHSLDRDINKIGSELANQALISAAMREEDEFSKIYHSSNPPKNMPTEGKIGRIWIYPAGDAHNLKENGEEI